jgi:hypothetical protein
MYLIYLDEAGNTWKDLANKEQPIHYISGIWVHEDDVYNIDKAIKSLYPLYEPYSQNFDFEFHWIDIVGGRKYFKHFSIEERLKTIKSLVGIYKKYNITFFSYGLNKLAHKHQYINPYHPHNVVFARILEDIDQFLQQKKERWLIIMDRNDDTGQKIINDFWSYKEKGIWFWTWRLVLKNLIDAVYYADSYNSNILQLADVIGYIYSSYYTHQYVSDGLSPLNYTKQQIFSHIKDIESSGHELYIWWSNFKDGKRQQWQEEEEDNSGI